MGRTSAAQDLVLQFRLPLNEAGDDYELPAYALAEFLGATDDVLALEIAYSLIPLGRWLPGSEGNDLYLVLTDLAVEQVDNYGWWKATASYKYDSNTGEGGGRSDIPGAKTLPFIKIGFNVGGRTKTITQSLQVLSRDAVIGLANRPLPNVLLGNAIGLTEDAVEGAEVYSSGLTLQITAYYFPEYVTYAFLKYLVEAIPSTNADTFLTFPPGTCLLQGCDGQATVTDVVPITFTVEVKPNILDQPDPPFPNLTCPGHSIIDYRYVKDLDEAAQTLLKMPTYRIIHRGYRASLFANLGFPTS